MITSINLRGLVHSEFYQYLKLVVDKVDEADPVALKLKTARDAAALMLPELKASLNLETANEETKQIQALDLARDNAIVGLTAIINGNTYHADAAKKEAAELLKLYLKAQGSNISKLNYQAETSVLSKIVDAFKSDPKYTPAIAMLGLGEWVANLETANSSFEARFKVRNTDISANADVSSFGELRKLAIPLYNKLTDLIESRFTTAEADAQPTAPYQKLINEINTLNDTFNSYVSSGGKLKPKPTDPVV